MKKSINYKKMYYLCTVDTAFFKCGFGDSGLSFYVSPLPILYNSSKSFEVLIYTSLIFCFSKCTRLYITGSPVKVVGSSINFS